MCVPYDDRVQGYHNRKMQEKNPIASHGCFNVGGTALRRVQLLKEARACRFEVTGVSLLPPTQKKSPVQEEKHHTDSEEEEEKRPEPPPRSLLPNADVKIIFDFITGNGQQGAYSCEGTYDATTREARVSPIRWIQRPDRNAVTMVPMTLRVCGGDDGTPTRLVGCVDQCGTVVAWAAGNREKIHWSLLLGTNSYLRRKMMIRMRIRREEKRLGRRRPSASCCTTNCRTSLTTGIIDTDTRCEARRR